MESNAQKSTTTIDYSYRLDQNKLQEIKNVFDLFDTKFDGTMSVNNLGTAMRGLGLIPSEADVERLAKMMDSHDPPTGKIDLSTFLVFMAREYRDLGSSKGKKIDEAFYKSFSNHKGNKIPIVAFRSTLTNSGERLTDEEVDEVIRKANHLKNNNEIEVDLKNVIATVKSVEEKRMRSYQKNL
mmetsp:Transcript_38559/g.39246  ORF Transcript_38559/g.39246 Transcript_38559/m.39246 type:complete len:183 (+) Transcript_38559:123-671(+)